MENQTRKSELSGYWLNLEQQHQVGEVFELYLREELGAKPRGVTGFARDRHGKYLDFKEMLRRKLREGLASYMVRTGEANEEGKEIWKRITTEEYEQFSIEEQQQCKIQYVYYVREVLDESRMPVRIPGWNRFQYEFMEKSEYDALRIKVRTGKASQETLSRWKEGRVELETISSLVITMEKERERLRSKGIEADYEISNIVVTELGDQYILSNIDPRFGFGTAGYSELSVIARDDYSRWHEVGELLSRVHKALVTPRINYELLEVVVDPNTRKPTEEGTKILDLLRNMEYDDPIIQRLIRDGKLPTIASVQEIKNGMLGFHWNDYRSGRHPNETIDALFELLSPHSIEEIIENPTLQWEIEDDVLRYKRERTNMMRRWYDEMHSAFRGFLDDRQRYKDIA